MVDNIVCGGLLLEQSRLHAPCHAASHVFQVCSLTLHAAALQCVQLTYCMCVVLALVTLCCAALGLEVGSFMAPFNLLSLHMWLIINRMHQVRALTQRTVGRISTCHIIGISRACTHACRGMLCFCGRWRLEHTLCVSYTWVQASSRCQL